MELELITDWRPLKECDFVPAWLGWIIAEHDLRVAGDEKRWAVFSPDQLYRYALVTVVNEDGEGDNGFCGLNPSKASHKVDDNTHTRCMDFARRWGFRRNWMTNIYAWRDKNPKALDSCIKRGVDPIGPANNAVLNFAAHQLKQFVAAWGNNGALQARGARVKRELISAGARLRIFRLTDKGYPEHPLYMPSTIVPQEWS